MRWVERAGLVGLIVSLVFVWAELRQTNAAIRGAAYQGLSEGYTNVQTMMSEDTERLAVFRRWWSEPPGDTLTGRDPLQVHSIVLAVLRNFENTQRQLSVGLISEEEAYAFLGFSFVGSPAFARWWSNNEMRYSEEFIEFMEAEMLGRKEGG